MPKYRPEESNPEGTLIRDIPIESINPFPNHPYKVKDDEAMQELIESIRIRGQLTPALVRKQYHGRYELISGHRRLHACRNLGLTTLRCEVREMTKEEAVIAMVESNFHRPEILPSEKAFAYKMRLEAMKANIVREEYPDAEIIRLTVIKIRNTKPETITDQVIGWTALLLGGVPLFDTQEMGKTINSVDHQYYLVNEENKQYFVLITDEFIIARALANRIEEKKFTIEDREFQVMGKVE